MRYAKHTNLAPENSRIVTEPHGCSMSIYLPKCLLCFAVLFQSAFGLMPQGNDTFLDGEALKTAILRGRVYKQESFLTEGQVQTVLQEISKLERENAFIRKGLSNTAVVNAFDEKLDRSICPVPWFTDALAGKDTREIPKIIRQLQTTLSSVLNKPTIADTNSGHECYFSKSEVGSRLPRHMDSRHEVQYSRILVTVALICFASNCVKRNSKDDRAGYSLLAAASHG